MPLMCVCVWEGYYNKLLLSDNIVNEGTISLCDNGWRRHVNLCKFGTRETKHHAVISSHDNFIYSIVVVILVVLIRLVMCETNRMEYKIQKYFFLGKWGFSTRWLVILSLPQFCFEFYFCFFFKNLNTKCDSGCSERWRECKFFSLCQVGSGK